MTKANNQVNKRLTDETNEQTHSWLGKSYIFINETKIKTWQGVFIIVFIGGLLAGLIWTTSLSLYQVSFAMTDCTTCFKGVCDGVCHPKKEGLSCPDCTSNGQCDPCQPTCTINSDCGIDGYIGYPFCEEDGNLYKEYEIHLCENASQCNSLCASYTEQHLIQNCQDLGCTDGRCVFINGATTTNPQLPGGIGNVIYVATQESRPSELGGRSGADNFCNNHIPSNLPTSCTNIHAFICVNSQDSVNNMPINYGYDSSIPVYWWHNSYQSYNILAKNWNDMLDNSIYMSEEEGTGLSFTMGDMALGGCYEDGSTYKNTCKEWTSSHGRNSVLGRHNSITGSWIGGPYVYINCGMSLGGLSVRCVAECSSQ